jgi:hypothetical protein
MSRFSGPQHRGAGRELDSVRRSEAEKRQAAEAARDKARAERDAEKAAIRALTDAEIAELLSAVRTVQMSKVLEDLTRLGVYRPNRQEPHP